MDPIAGRHPVWSAQWDRDINRNPLRQWGVILPACLATRLVDSDAEIESRRGPGLTSPGFDVEGEAGFRRRETAVLADLATQSASRDSHRRRCDSGEENRQLMTDTGIVVFLNVSVAQQLKRTGSGEGRPLFKQDREETLTQRWQSASHFTARRGCHHLGSEERSAKLPVKLTRN